MTNRIRTSMAKRDQGFTLIELLVVIIIIGILAAIAIPVFLNQRKKGVDASMKSDAKNAATAVETWITDNPQTAIPTLSLAAATSGTAGTALEGMKTSPGNALNLKPVTGVTGAYCIDIKNANSTDGTKFVVYNSNAGGLQDGGKVTQAAC